MSQQQPFEVVPLLLGIQPASCSPAAVTDTMVTRAWGVKMTLACCHPRRSQPCLQQPDYRQNQVPFPVPSQLEAGSHPGSSSFCSTCSRHRLADPCMLLMGSSYSRAEFWGKCSVEVGRTDKIACIISTMHTCLFAPLFESVFMPQSHKIIVRQPGISKNDCSIDSSPVLSDRVLESFRVVQQSLGGSQLPVCFPSSLSGT